MEGIGFIACHFITSHQVGNLGHGIRLNNDPDSFPLSVFEPCRASVLALYCEGSLVSEVREGQRCGVILDQTSFYAEKGGQAHDQGYFTKDGLQVIDHITSYFYVFDKQTRLSYQLWLCFSGCAVPCELCPSGWGLRGTSSHGSRDFENWGPSASSCG